MSKKRRGQAKRKVVVTNAENAAIDKCVRHFEEKAHLFQIAADGVVSACVKNPELKKFIHFIKYRLKDPKHLRDKLLKKALEAKKAGKKPAINAANLFERITDLAGVRILHLYTDQIPEINKYLLDMFDEQKYKVVDGPVAHIWDDEAQAYFQKLGFQTISREDMYTSVVSHN